MAFCCGIAIYSNTLEFVTLIPYYATQNASGIVFFFFFRKPREEYKGGDK